MTSAKPIVYIGQTENVWARLDAHNSKKDFWQTAVLGISKTGSFTQSHIRHLEWYCIQEAKATNRFALNNDQFPDEPYVTDPMEADLLDSFDVISTLVSALGFPVFEPIVKAGAAEVFIARARMPMLLAKWSKMDLSFGRTRWPGRKSWPSQWMPLTSIRKSLIDGGVLSSAGWTFAVHAGLPIFIAQWGSRRCSWADRQWLDRVEGQRTARR